MGRGRNQHAFIDQFLGAFRPRRLQAGNRIRLPSVRGIGAN